MADDPRHLGVSDGWMAGVCETSLSSGHNAPINLAHNLVTRVTFVYTLSSCELVLGRDYYHHCFTVKLETKFLPYVG